MKVILYGRKEITSKKGVHYTAYDGFSTKGTAVNFLLTDEQEKDFGIPKEKVITAEQIETLFETFPTVEVEYGQFGRVEGVEVEDDKK